MAKLMKTTEVFQVSTCEEAEKMIEDFKGAIFPKLISYEIIENGAELLLVLQKELGVEFDKMKFE